MGKNPKKLLLIIKIARKLLQKIRNAASSRENFSKYMLISLEQEKVAWNMKSCQKVAEQLVKSPNLYSFIELIFISLGWALYDNILPWHNQELHQSNSYTKCYGVYKTVQHNGKNFCIQFTVLIHNSRAPSDPKGGRAEPHTHIKLTDPCFWFFMVIMTSGMVCGAWALAKTTLP